MKRAINFSRNVFFRGFVLTIIFLAFSRVGNAQESAHQISLQSGLQHYATSEPILSPLHYRGSYFIWQPSYAYHGNRHYHRLQVSRITTDLMPAPLSNAPARRSYVDLLGWQLQYTFLRKIHDYTHWALWVGGALEGTYFDKSIFHPNDFIDGRTADAFITPSPSVAGTTLLGKNHQLRGQFSVAPLAYVAGRTYASNRPPIEMINQELTVSNALRYGDWLTFVNFINLRGELVYGYSLGNHWELQLSYGFQYYYYDKLGPFDVRSVVNTLLTGVAFRL